MYNRSEIIELSYRCFEINDHHLVLRMCQKHRVLVTKVAHHWPELAYQMGQSTQLTCRFFRNEELLMTKVVRAGLVWPRAVLTSAETTLFPYTVRPT